MTPRAQLIGNALEFGFGPGGYSNDKVESLVLGGVDRVAIEAQERQARCPGNAFVAIDECVVVGKGVRQIPD